MSFLKRMTKNGKKIKHIRRYPSLCISVVLLVAILLLSIKIAYTLKNPIHDCVHSLSDEIFKMSFVSYFTYYLISIVIGIVVFVLICIYKTVNIPVRNKEYIKELLQSDQIREPAVDRETLKRRIYGEGTIIEEVDNDLQKLIDNNIAPIKSFITEGHDSILSIEAKWGSGKTTDILIAVNEINDDKYRYIYESAFKYRGNNCEFVKDILHALSDTMREIGIKNSVYSEVKALISNLGASSKETMSRIINSPKIDEISSELVLDINKYYNNADINNVIIVIIDDLDRLDGNDIVKVISLLSVIRRLSFIKIIIPADISIVHESLKKANVVDCVRFTEKYLPSQKRITLKSNFEIAQSVAINMLYKGKNSDEYGMDGVNPAMSAIYLAILAKTMRDLVRGFRKTSYDWIAYRGQKASENIDYTNDQINTIFEIPNVIVETNNEAQFNKYSWGYDEKSDIREIQNIVYRLENVNRLGPEYARDHFSDQDYIYSVGSWIFKYMKDNWDILGLSIRDLMDYINCDNIDYMNLPKTMTEQFIYVFNQLFPDSKLTINSNLIKKP